WLTGMRGGEKCLEIFCELFPNADIFTLVHIPEKVTDTINRMNIKTSFIQNLPFAKTKYRNYLPLFPIAVESFDMRGYDIVLSSSHCVAKGALTSPETYHICYCYTPMRYAWDMYHEYFSHERLGAISKFYVPFFMNRIRVWDEASSRRVDDFIAISKHVATRIKHYYRRESSVIYPPVDTDFYTPMPEVIPETMSRNKNFYLMISALTYYKRIDIAIKAFNELNLPLIIIGSGPEEKRLKALAGHNITFLGWQPDNILHEYYAMCKGFIFPGKEDFGITPLEAQSCGKGVIAYAEGGVLETVKHGVNGVLFKEQNPHSLIEAVKTFEKMRFDKDNIRKNALCFNKQRFKKEIKDAIMNKYKLTLPSLEKRGNRLSPFSLKRRGRG
ncbi:glycosyltransferase, partial [bacterium]|nr:glycosyltransferase [bacterium]